MGGDISYDPSYLTVINSSFVNSYTKGNLSLGGTISAIIANVTNCTFVNSSTKGKYSPGGTIHSLSDLVVKDSRFLNSSTIAKFSPGGAIWVESGNVSIDNSNFTKFSTNNNRAKGKITH